MSFQYTSCSVKNHVSEGQVAIEFALELKADMEKSDAEVGANRLGA